MNREALAEKMVDRCDGIVTMDSEQRAACKAWMIECLREPGEAKELPAAPGFQTWCDKCGGTGFMKILPSATSSGGE